jgi:ribose/xylose/arabinose/galactoside ABC-type transport system permease subunit
MAAAISGFRQGAVTVKAFVVSGGVAAVLLVLAMGGETPFYRLTYGIPVWSSMRWPFKFLLFSQPALLLAATLGLELWTRYPAQRLLTRWIPVILFVAGAALVSAKLDRVPLGRTAEMLGVVGACATLAALPHLGRHRSPMVLLLLGTFVSAGALTANAHDMGMKRYAEPYRKIGADISA